MFLAEFLWRGRHASENRAPAYHVILGDQIMQFGQATIQYSNAMTPKQASDAGFDLPAIINAINTETLAKLNDANDKINAMTIENEQLKAALSDKGEAVKPA